MSFTQPLVFRLLWNIYCILSSTDVLQAFERRMFFLSKNYNISSRLLSEVKDENPNEEFKHLPERNKSWQDNSPRTRFVAVGLLNVEQLTKTRMHFGEVLAYAHKHNRTLILPSCGNGTVGSSAYCTLHLSAYFDIDTISKHVDWVTEEFYGQVSTDSGKAFFILLQEQDDCDLDYLVANANPYIKSRADVQSNFVCVKCYNGKFNGRWHSHKVDDMELVVIVKKSYFSCVEDENTEARMVGQGHLQYNGHIVKIAAKFAEQFLGARYLAVHWRLEKFVMMGQSYEDLLHSLEALRRKLKHHLHSSNLTGVYIAADMGWNEKKIYSSSMFWKSKVQRKWMSNIMTLLREEFSPPELEDYDPNFENLDSGIRGVLEKIICARSYIFVFPTQIESSYLAEIKVMRQMSLTAAGQPLAPDGGTMEGWT